VATLKNEKRLVGLLKDGYWQWSFRMGIVLNWLRVCSVAGFVINSVGHSDCKKGKYIPVTGRGGP
jgi:hypothetical protein